MLAIMQRSLFWGANACTSFPEPMLAIFLEKVLHYICLGNGKMPLLYTLQQGVDHFIHNYIPVFNHTSFLHPLSHLVLQNSETPRFHRLVTSAYILDSDCFPPGSSVATPPYIFQLPDFFKISLLLLLFLCSLLYTFKDV